MVYELSKFIKNMESIIHLEIKEIRLFGSCGRGEETVYSDLDLAIIFKKDTPPQRNKTYDLRDALETFIEETFKRPVDFVHTNENNLDSQNQFNVNSHIRKEGKVLWTRTVI